MLILITSVSMAAEITRMGTIIVMYARTLFARFSGENAGLKIVFCDLRTDKNGG